MIKKFSYIIFVMIIAFSFQNRVSAGVCDGLSIDASSGTCRNTTNPVYINKPDYLEDKYGSYFLYPGYVATTSTGSAMAFCLDPGLQRPTNTTPLTYLREFDNEESSDEVKKYNEGLYRMYYHFYNELLWQQNNGGLNDNYVNQQRSYFQYATRIWTYLYKFAYVDENNATYKKDADRFKTCSHFVDNRVEEGKISTESNYCFGNDTHKDNIANYYETATKGSIAIWENPIKITSNSSILDSYGTTYYRFEFKVSYNNFFDDTYSQGVSYRDIQIGSAEFYLYDLSVNGLSCSDPSNSIKCYNYNGGGVISNGTENTFMVELSEEQYNAYKEKSSDGTVNVTMNYGYRHPLNIDNLYTARYDEKNTYQRMLVMQTSVYKDSVTIGKEPEKSTCKHTSSGYINNEGDKVDNLTNFIPACCLAVNKDLLSESELSFYNSKCLLGTVKTEEYLGEIKACNTSVDYDDVLDNEKDNNYEDYKLSYKKVTQINAYCTETCTETIEINDLKGKYTTVAGRYFEFDEYPNLVASKTCTVDIDYGTWRTSYKTNLESLVKAYNSWQFEVAGNSSDPEKGEPCDWENGYITEYYYEYDFDYPVVSISGYYDLSVKNVNYNETFCGKKKWKVKDELEDFQEQASKANAIASLKNDLKVCNNRLFNAINDEDFYDFEQDLNYYYYQTYSNGRIVKNSERLGLDGIDDSGFVYNESISGGSTKDGVDYGENVTYDTLTETGISPETIFTYDQHLHDPEIERNVTYNIKYEKTKYKKYVNIYTGNIVTIVGSSSSYTLLGYGYDTNISAIEKSNNKTYYSFSKLGASDNKIFNYFKTGNEIKRECTYQITNDIIKLEECNPEVEECCNPETETCETKLNVVYRIVDPNNIDPNNRLGTKGFKNWDNIKGNTVKNAIESDDTYNPLNLEYSFTLDSATIKKIREYNANCDARGCDPISYSDTSSSYSKLECDNNGNECISKFISELSKTSGVFGSEIATNTDGRNKWKYLEYNDRNGYYINIYKRADVNFDSLSGTLSSKGVDVTP